MSLSVLNLPSCRKAGAWGLKYQPWTRGAMNHKGMCIPDLFQWWYPQGLQFVFRNQSPLWSLKSLLKNLSWNPKLKMFMLLLIDPKVLSLALQDLTCPVQLFLLYHLVQVLTVQNFRPFCLKWVLFLPPYVSQHTSAPWLKENSTFIPERWEIVYFLW